MYQLQPLIQHHPNFERFKINLQEGIDYLLNDTSKEVRIKMLEDSTKRGNHKSALLEEQSPHVTKLMTQDLELGYGITITVNSLNNIPGAEVYPIGYQNQLTINKQGDVIPKRTVTHDPSHSRKAGLSINQREKEEEVPGVIFGHTMFCFLHLIHHLHWNHPNNSILCNKIKVKKPTFDCTKMLLWQSNALQFGS